MQNPFRVFLLLIENAKLTYAILINFVNQCLKQAFFLTPAVEKTKTQAKNSSQKLKPKTQPPGGFSLQLGKFKKKT